ncbi:hypothetical protein GHI93_08475 [Lactococcus hircilactis]|uniref:Mid-cell-anchored protein Z n=1 Tax=Lactococcus hircilactis TaxID=1494462 RepID=A0A7X1ZBB5_9LACT|nr:cell division site-positioning protein MapZ family protein [Lactococcus hircilactis]MQW39960.1 hypothetical protein [Lactococcus hircilactis]
MTTDQKDPEKKFGEKTLKLKDLNQFTIGEIVEKSKRVDQENNESETVLDKYIRQHRAEIEEAKNKDLEDYIKSERSQLNIQPKNEPKEAQKEAEITGDAQHHFVASETQDTREADKKEQESKRGKEEPALPSTTETQVKSDDFSHDVSELLTPKKELKVFEPTFDAVTFADEPAVASHLEAQVQKESEAAEIKEPTLKKAVEESTQETVQESTVKSTQAPSEKESVQASKSETLPQKEESVAHKKSYKRPLIVGACAVILIAFGASYLALQNGKNHTQPVKTTQASKTSSAWSKFNQEYKNFFIDSAQTELRNREFSQLNQLSNQMNQVTNASEHSKAQKKYDTLKTQVDAINQVNGLFENDVINDGTLSHGTLKAGATLFATPTTSNAKLNRLLNEAMTDAKNQKAAQTSASVAKSQAKASSEASQKASSAASAEKSTPASSAATTTTSNPNGLSASGVTLDNSLSRVQPQANLNSSDPAFSWGAGVKESVLDKARSRGYITGDNYILAPVAIHTTNGNGSPAGIRSGYYNLYDPSGHYLFSINCKTGYFFGNASNHSLDFSE